MNDRQLARLFEAGTAPRTPRRAWLAPFAGLVYIILMPFVGLGSLILLIVRRARQLAGELRHRTAHAPVKSL